MQKIIFLPVIGLLATAAILLQSQSGDHESKELKYDAMMELLYRSKGQANDYSSFLPSGFSSSPKFARASEEELATIIKSNPGVQKLIGTFDVYSFADINSKKMQDNALATCIIFRVDESNVDPLPEGRLSVCSNRKNVPFICEGIPFASEPALGRGTAFAINDSVICTTFHYDLPWFLLRFVFGYTENVPLNKCDTFSTEQVFQAVKVLAYDCKTDYILIKVNKRIPKKWQVKKINLDHPYNKLHPVYMAGHPLGLSLKLAIDGQIYSRNGSLVLTDLDAFMRNSGSPVFSSETHELIGMLRGTSSRGIKDSLTSIDRPCWAYEYRSDYLDDIAAKFIPITFLKTIEQ
jgi:hypothetical protein